MWIIVGLGNPGSQYKNTRHNVGYQVISFLKKRLPVQETHRRKYFKAWKVGGTEDVFLVQPRTFMNESGVAVKNALQFFQGESRNLLVIHDDTAIPLGEIKITVNKGPGGHKGVLSLINELGTKDFFRVRLGIGKERIPVSLLDYVLSEFSEEEIPALNQAIKNAATACCDIIRLGPEKAMTKWNTQPVRK